MGDHAECPGCRQPEHGVLNVGARNMPFISLAVSVIAGLISLAALALWFM